MESEDLCGKARRRQRLSKPAHLAVVVLAVALLDVAAAIAATPAIVLPLRLRNRLPVLVAKINGADVPLVLDTGDQSAVALQSSVLQQVGAQPTDESTKLQFAKGPAVSSRVFRIARLELGAAVFTQVSARVDVHDPAYPATDAGQKGFLGTGLLKPYKVVVDYRAGKATLIAADAPAAAAAECTGTVVPFAAPEAPDEPVADVGSDWGRFSAWWDTGSPASVISRRFIEAGQPATGSTRMRTRKLILGSRDLGPWQFEVADLKLPPWFNGFIGYDFFAAHVVCFDFPGKRLLVRH